MTAPLDAKLYRAALAEFLASGAEDALETANLIGHDALAAGMSIGEIAEQHNHIRCALLDDLPPTPEWIERSVIFFIEIASVFDMALRGYREAVGRLNSEVEERRRTEEDLREVTFALSRQREALERRVAERTHELSQKAADLEIANLRLQRANRDLDEFVYAAAHDLKEPLRAIGNHASMLIEDYGTALDAPALRRFDRMRALCRRMERLIADVAFFARIGHASPVPAGLDPADAAALALRELAPFIEARGARIRIASPLPRVAGDPQLVTALFRLLVDNAIRFNDSEAPQVEILSPPAEQGHAAEGLALFAIRDNGIGVDPRFHSEIFRIFKRLNRDGVYGEGTGAGLTHAKKIVESHGGRIWLESIPGRGSTFLFTLGSDTE